MLKISIAGCLGLPSVMSTQFTLVLVYLEWFRCNSFLKCVLQPKIAKKLLKPPILGVQGRSRSSMLVPLESLSAVLVMISSKSVYLQPFSHYMSQ